MPVPSSVRRRAHLPRLLRRKAAFAPPKGPVGVPAGPVAADTTILYNRLGYAASVDSSNQLLAWLDGIGSLLQVIDGLCRDGTDTNGNAAPGWSQILDVNRCPNYALGWLGQFVGVRFNSLTTSDAAQRNAIQHESAFTRGTVPAMIAAAQATLLGARTVTVIERYARGAYSIAFITYGPQTPSPSSTLAALVAAKPGGLALTYMTSSAETWFDVAATGLTWAGLLASGATWGQVSTILPPAIP